MKFVKCESSEPVAEQVTYDAKDEVKKLLDKLAQNIKGMQKSYATLSCLFSEENIKDTLIANEMRLFSTVYRRTLPIINDIASYSGLMSAEERKEMNAEHLEFIRSGKKLSIIFPTLIPKRIKSDSPITHAQIKQMYEKPFSDFYRENNDFMYDEKAVIVYKHCYKNEKNIRDVDNYETKCITDLIAAKLSYDDSPKHCTIYHDTIIDESIQENHTEIEVFPFCDFHKYLSQ